MRWTLFAIAGVIAGADLFAADEPLIRVRFADDRGNSERMADGRILVEAMDGGILLEDKAGVLWSITPDRLQNRDELTETFQWLDARDLGRELQRELGEEFQVIETPHYVLCANADPEFAEWVGLLFERLLRAFLQTWERAGLEVREPAAPLAAIVFATQQDFAEFATRDAGPELAASAGYYSVRTNRIVLHDLASTISGRNHNQSDINRRAAAAPGNVATIVHEATHQIAFNCGVHLRYADNPAWLTEGLAMYCETPDLDTGSGWRSIGKLNPARLRDYRTFAETRRATNSLASLIADDSRFRDPQAAADAYAESWALTYFLIRTRRDAYVAFLRGIAAKTRLQWDTTDQRLAEFEAAFGDMDDLETEFQRYVARLGSR